MAYATRNRFRTSPQASGVPSRQHRTLATADGLLEWTEVISYDGNRMRRARGEGALAGKPISKRELEERIMLHAIWYDPSMG